MKSYRKIIIRFLLIIGILSINSPILINNQKLIVENINSTSNYKDLNESAHLRSSFLSAIIHIDNNWTDVKAEGVCTGNGTYSDPYVIKDLVIDGDGEVNCILIENSEVFFKIENCSISNSFFGIRLEYIKNGRILNNTCSSNVFSGISLHHSSNNTISGNTVRDSQYFGISLYYSDMNKILENTENDNSNYGIHLTYSDNNLIGENILNTGISLDGTNNNISSNLMKRCGLGIFPSNSEYFYSQNIETSNLVNGKPLYYYVNEINLDSTNFTDAGQIILVSCENSLIYNLNLSYSETGISLINSDNITIKGNTVNHNRRNGLYLFGGGHNNVSKNNFSYNKWYGISLEFNTNSIFLENNISYNNYYGLDFKDLENSLISGNDINYNKIYGISFIHCINNAIIGNTLIGNEKCFKEITSEGNIFEDNLCRDRPTPILGYNLFFLLGILSIMVIIVGKKINKN